MLKTILLQIPDSMVVDTTEIGYQIAYYVTSWLPFIVIVIIFILIIRKRYKFED